MITTFLVGLVLSGPSTVSVRVDGDGYLRFAQSGHIVYAKQAAIGVQNGALTGPNGATVEPEIDVPDGATALTISLDGSVSVSLGAKQPQVVGQLVLALFAKKTALVAQNGYLATTEKATLQNPGDGLAGVIRVGGPTSVASIKTGAKPTQAPAFTGKPEVHINSFTEIPGPKFTLGDIAEIKAAPDVKAKLEAIDMGQAPVAGIPRPIVASRLLYLFLQAGFKANDIQTYVPSDAKVALKVQTVGNDQFVEAAKAAVIKSLGVQVPLSCSQAYPDFIAPLGDMKLDASAPQRGQSGFSVLVTVLVDGKKINSRLVNLTADLSAGSIKSGDTVRILIRRAGATIEVTGKARTSGFLGQQITVVSSTGSVHQATVLSASEVEVKI